MEGVQTLWKGIEVYKPRGGVQTLWKGIKVYKPRGGCTNPMERN